MGPVELHGVPNTAWRLETLGHLARSEQERELLFGAARWMNQAHTELSAYRRLRAALRMAFQRNRLCDDPAVVAQAALDGAELPVLASMYQQMLARFAMKTRSEYVVGQLGGVG